MINYGNNIYVFGGYDGQTRFGDLYKCSINKNYRWKLIKPSGESVPLNRFGHSAVVIEH